MKKRAAQDRPALDLMEEAVHLLRSVPLECFASYLLGTLPFLLGLLYFWTDMSWSAVASQHRGEASLGVAFLFLLMKTGQATFSRQLRGFLSGPGRQSLTWREGLAFVRYQAIIQPSKLFLLPVAALATIPFGWVWAFYESATALGAGDGLREFFARARRHASLWPRQNHTVLLVYLLLVCVVFFNLAILVFLLPQLLRMFTGVETFVTQSPRSFFNTTSLAVAGALTYLACDPLLKAIYVLRCFQGDSLYSGEDLIAELRALPRVGRAIALIAAFLSVAPLARATPPPSPPAGAVVSVAEMNRAIDEAMKEPRFSWRLPRQAAREETKRSWPFVDAIGRFLQTTGRVIKNAIQSFFRWLDRIFTPPNGPTADPSRLEGWQMSSRNWMTLLLIILGLTAFALVIQTIRQLRLRRQQPVAAPVAAVKLDLADENVTADLLPEDGWLLLARNHLGKGELRFALRALFFAGLAHLGTRELLTLARHKSNRDYWRELRRRASDQPPLLDAFHDNVAVVEWVWYGEHAIDEGALERFENNLEAIRKC